jgi:hypothetical protein
VNTPAGLIACHRPAQSRYAVPSSGKRTAAIIDCASANKFCNTSTARSIWAHSSSLLVVVGTKVITRRLPVSSPL